MTQLKFEKLQIPVADFGYEGSPLPPLSQLKSVPWPVEVGDDVFEEDRKYINYGCQTPLLPYMLQDRYSRKRKMATFEILVLENEYIKASFLPQLGGRLWSLIYKPKNRELLYVNPVFQPANLAYRNAWFSGGVEWNMAMPAHNPFTCDKPFFAVIDNKNCPVLRMYEWERIRNAPFQVDFYIPKNSRFLHVRTKLINPHNHEIPGYWFSNIAVPENLRHRVIAPSDIAYTFDYSPTRFGVKTAKIPINNETDITYPTNLDIANDFFYRLNNNQWPWITSLDENGSGLIQASTSKLKGRKLFVWGTNEGGRRWQDFLTKPGNPYVEIQAGFGRTQVECRPLKPQSSTQWLEIYGYIETDPSIIHGKDWNMAVSEVEKNLKKAITFEELEQELANTEEISKQKPANIIQKGSGWGNLELKADAEIIQTVQELSGLSFCDENNEEKYKIWENLLNNGVFAEQSPLELTPSYQTGEKWLVLLENSIAEGKNENWTAYYHLGVMYYVKSQKEKSIQALKKSYQLRPNHWSYRILANIEFESNNASQALNYMDKGWQLCDQMPEFAEEYAAMLVKSKSFEKLCKLLDSLPENVKNRPRMQIAAAQSAFNSRKFDRVEDILSKIELINIRECETTLTDIWFEVQAIKRADQLNRKVDDKIREYVQKNLKPPKNIDFRMN
ncbi:MAG: DUF5107 domain-containing protein [Sedimentisphaeraceae bacterium JB056]